MPESLAGAIVRSYWHARLTGRWHEITEVPVLSLGPMHFRDCKVLLLMSCVTSAMASF